MVIARRLEHRIANMMVVGSNPYVVLRFFFSACLSLYLSGFLAWEPALDIQLLMLLISYALDSCLPLQLALSNSGPTALLACMLSEEL